ncbi:MAG TPA: hypothetical protein VJB99_03805 [Patescibacteria group bacterium]|nr:hypothetical protein [Patescibacteria group bacterium]
MTRRKIGFLSIVVFLFLLLAGWIGGRQLNRRTRELVRPSTSDSSEGKLEEKSVQVLPPLSEQDIQKMEIQAPLQALAKTFAERYGSYSNESAFANLTDVLPLMSQRFRAETEKMLATSIPSTAFYGVTTRVLAVSIETMDDSSGIAQTSIHTQREETTGTVQNVVTIYQILTLDFVKENSTWKVDRARWQ